MGRPRRPLPRHRNFTVADATPFMRKASSPDRPPALLAARNFLLNHGFASDPDGRWRNRTHVAVISDTTDGFSVVTKLHAEESDLG